MYFMIGDEHYSHDKMRTIAKRPFDTCEQMTEALIAANNTVVKPGDFVVHDGDFCFGKKAEAEVIIARLNGQHIFLRGNHDHWMNAEYHERWSKTIDGQKVVVDHFPGRTWDGADHGSWQVYAHCHGNLPPIGKQWDCGVDNKEIFKILPNHVPWAPVSFDELKVIMATLKETPKLFDVEKEKAEEPMTKERFFRPIGVVISAVDSFLKFCGMR